MPKKKRSAEALRFSNAIKNHTACHVVLSLTTYLFISLLVFEALKR